MRNAAKREVAGMQTVDRAITVLHLLARRGEAGVGEVAAEIDVHKSTASRLLAALEARGLVEQDGYRGRYRLGVGLVPLVGAVADRLDVVRRGRPVCERLAADVGETVTVSVLQDRWAVCVDQARGPSAISTYNWVGQPTPLHCTSNGKVLLAYSSGVDDATLLPLSRFTTRTITDPAALEEELAAIRTTGIGRTIEEYEVGLNAVAAPVHDGFGVVVAAISVSGPSYRFTPERIEDIVPAVRTGAAEVSRRMGFAGL